MNSLLESLCRLGRRSAEELAQEHGLTTAEVEAQIAGWENEGVILGYQAVIDPVKAGFDGVSAFIEVKLSPERGGGFNRLARRVASFDQVVSCYLASGGYDLMVVVEGADLMEVAQFVTDKLSSMEGVLSTATHFRLKVYKENGFQLSQDEEDGRLAVAP